MRKRNSQREGGENALFSASLSSGQMVIAISVSLFVMLTCFLVGVLVGKYDSSLDRPSLDTAAVRPATEGTEPGQTSPRPMAQVSRPESARAAEPPPPAPRVVDLDPLPAGRTAPSGPETAGNSPPPGPPVPAPTIPVDDARPVGPGPEPASFPPEPERPDSPPRGDAPRLVLDPVPVPGETRPAPIPPVAPPPEPPPATVPEPPPATVAVAPGPVAISMPPAAGAYGIQVISLTGDDRARKAREVQSTLKEKHGLESTVLIQQNGARYAVVVVGFESQAAAADARDRLRRETPFKDCFVRSL